MPVVEAQVQVPVEAEVAFAVSQSTGETRLTWDPFIRRQFFTDGADGPGKGVRTTTRHRSGVRMISRYVSYRPPTNVGMDMVEGPWFFDAFAGGWQFRPLDPAPDGTPMTEVIWRYSFRCRPRWLAPVTERIGRFVMQRELDRRIAGYAAGCQNPAVLQAAVRQLRR